MPFTEWAKLVSFDEKEGIPYIMFNFHDGTRQKWVWSPHLNWTQISICGYGNCTNDANPKNDGSGRPICDDCYHNGNYDGMESHG